MCNAIAEPQHEISWSFTDADDVTAERIAATNSEDSSDDRYTINRMRNETMLFGELTVSNVEFEDRGVYTCTAQNDIGRETAAANLTVHGNHMCNVLTSRLCL